MQSEVHVMKIETTFFFTDRCAESDALHTEGCSRGKIEAMMTYGDSPARPAPIRPKWRNKVHPCAPRRRRMPVC